MARPKATKKAAASPPAKKTAVSDPENRVLSLSIDLDIMSIIDSKVYFFLSCKRDLQSTFPISTPDLRDGQTGHRYHNMPSAGAYLPAIESFGTDPIF